MSLLCLQDLMDKEQLLNFPNTLDLNVPQLQDGLPEHLQIKILNNFKNQNC